MNINKYKAVEKMLSRYKMVKINIENMQEEIKFLQEADGIGGISTDNTGVQTSGNKSITERTALSNIDKAERLKRQIQKSILEIETINRAMEGLTETKQEIIKGRYFEGMQWWQISGIVRYSERHCRQLRTDAINDLIMGIYGPRAV